MPVLKKRDHQTESRLLLEAAEPVDLPPAEIADNAVLAQFDKFKPFIPELLDALRAGGRVLAAAADVVPALRHSRIENTRMGVRPIPQDGLPVVGLLPGLQNLYVAVTHSGVTLALILGRLIALEVALHRPQRVLAPFRPERLAI